jgi:hypothetical protein
VIALVKLGVPYHVAESWPADRRLAAMVVFGEVSGRVFDWDAFRWAPE